MRRLAKYLRRNQRKIRKGLSKQLRTTQLKIFCRRILKLYPPFFAESNLGRLFEDGLAEKEGFSFTVRKEIPREFPFGAVGIGIVESRRKSE